MFLLAQSHLVPVDGTNSWIDQFSGQIMLVGLIVLWLLKFMNPFSVFFIICLVFKELVVDS